MSSKANASKKKSQQLKRNPKRKIDEEAEISEKKVIIQDSFKEFIIQDSGKNIICSVQRSMWRLKVSFTTNYSNLYSIYMVMGSCCNMIYKKLQVKIFYFFSKILIRKYFGEDAMGHC